MSNNKIEMLLNLLAEYNDFCNAPLNTTPPKEHYMELSVNELELVAAAKHMPSEPLEKNNPDSLKIK